MESGRDVRASGKRPAIGEQSVLRSGRAKKPRDFFHREQVENGEIFFHRDEVRGLNQPEGHKWSPEEVRYNKKYSHGLSLFNKYLKPRGWKWTNRGNSDRYCYILRARGIRKQDEIPYINMFPSPGFHNLVDQYEQDGNTMDQIIARASPDNADAGAGSSVAALPSLEDSVAANSNGLKCPADQEDDLNANNQYAKLSSEPPVDDHPDQVAVKTEDDRDNQEPATEPTADEPPRQTAVNTENNNVHVKLENVVDLLSDNPPPPPCPSHPLKLWERLQLMEEEEGCPSRSEKGIKERIELLEKSYGIKDPTGTLKERVAELERHLG